MKKLNNLMLLIMVILVLGCSKSEDEESGIQLKVSAVNPNVQSRLVDNGRIVNNSIIFTDFKISIRDVVFKNDDDPSSNLDTDEIQFRGPYQIDLLNGSDAITQTIGNAFVPDGIYKEMRFKFHKDEDLSVTDDLYDRSIYIEGTIDGVPFEFWHDTSENLDLGRSTGVLVQNGIVDLTVQFDISQFLSSLNNIDLSQATDENNDGLIEIYPNDQDGNQDIAYDLKENIKMAADLMNY